MRATQLAMGSVSPHGTFVHLYVNGLYWGLYNPVERPDAAFASSYLGGEENEWDIIQDLEAKDGNLDAWNEFIDVSEEGFLSNEAYQRIQGNNLDGTPNPGYEKLVDMENFIDYMILNFYATTWDWDFQNWYVGRRKGGSEGFQFFTWDAEQSNYEVNVSKIDTDFADCPTSFFQKLRLNEEFRMLFSDRVYKHFFNDGALSPENCVKRYGMLADKIDRAVAAESARWGDVVQEPPFTRDEDWIPTRDWLLDNYFTNRSASLLGYFWNESLYSGLESPDFFINEEKNNREWVEPGDMFSMSSSNGSVFYVTDGTDPRLPSIANITEFIPSGAVWQYLDNGSDQGASWRVDPLPWASGPAQLGYGNGDEATVVKSGREGGDWACHVTTYFRHDFQVNDSSNITNLTLRLVRDDGAVVYLNGQEILRSNMEVGIPITNTTLANDIGGNDWVKYQVNVTGILVNGENHMAVEIHQGSLGSSDISFDMQLWVKPDPGAISPEAMQYLTPISIQNQIHIKARTFNGSQWSPMREAKYTPTWQNSLFINEFMADNDRFLPDPEGNYSDWIELYNGGNESINLSGMYLSDNLAGFPDWRFPDGTYLEPGEFLLVWADGQPWLGGLHTSFKLDATGEEIGLFARDGTTLYDSVRFGVQQRDVSYGRFPDGSDNWTALRDHPTPGSPNRGNYPLILSDELFINEFMANNDAIKLAPNATDFPDWIELYNSGDSSINLSGMYLTDVSSIPRKWRFPDNSTIAAGSFLLLKADGYTDLGKSHTNFRLNVDGEEIRLFASDGETLIDFINYGQQSSDVSYGRYPDGRDSWEFMRDHPTPGMSNRIDDVIPIPSELYINEFMADNERTVRGPSGGYPDWIELYNAANVTVNLSGMYLTDNFSSPDRYQFPAGANVTAGGFLLIWADDRFGPENFHTGFGLNASGEEIGLFAADGITMIDSVLFSGQSPDVSYGRYPDGNVSWEYMQAHPTPGVPNRLDNTTYIPTGIFINEFMANNDATALAPNATDYPDWIELYNSGNQSVELGGMYLSDNLSNPTRWQIIGGTVIGPMGFLLIIADGNDGDGYPHASFRLNASGEEIYLFAEDGLTVIDSLEFSVQSSDVSYGRYPDGNDSWEYMHDHPTPGAPNRIDDPIPAPPDIYINEFMADNKGIQVEGKSSSVFPDWIELYNGGNTTVDLGGMYLTDNLRNSTRWRFGEGILIEPGGFILVIASGNAAKGPLHTSFKLNASGEEIGLFAPDGVTLIDSINFSQQSADVSYGRYPDGSDSWSFFHKKSTPGKSNKVDWDYDQGDGNGHGNDNVDDLAPGAEEKEKGKNILDYSTFALIFIIVLLAMNAVHLAYKTRSNKRIHLSDEKNREEDEIDEDELPWDDWLEGNDEDEPPWDWSDEDGDEGNDEKELPGDYWLDVYRDEDMDEEDEEDETDNGWIGL